MDPQQTPPPAQPGGYPPQTPPAQPQFGTPVPMLPVDPQAQFTPQPTPFSQPQPAPYTPPQPHTPRPAPQPTSWYTPPPKPDADKPADVSSYLQAAGVAPTTTPGAQPSTPTPTQSASVPGQMINGQYSIDYLDQMAAPAKPAMDKKFLFAGIGIGVALILAAFLMFSTKKTASTANEVKLYTTMVDVNNSTERSGEYIKNSKLSSINANIRTNFTNASRDMTQPLTNMGLNPTNLEDEAREGQYHDEEFATALEDARLNGVYDRVYANELNTKMKYIIAYMDSIKQRNSRKSMQEFIAKNEASFKTIQKSIDDWSKSDEATFY